MGCKFKVWLACSVAVVGIFPGATAAVAEPKVINIPSEDAAISIPEFAQQADIQIIAPVSQLRGLKTPAVSGRLEIGAALNSLISGTGLEVAQNDGATIILRRRMDRLADVDAGGSQKEPLAEADAGGGGSAPDSRQAVESVVVTGSRIQNGNNQPTPVTVISVEQLQATTPSNIPDGLNKQPIFASATSSNSSQLGTNSIGGVPSGNFLDLRGLGSIRTLVLQNGHRVPGTYFDTTVDSNMLPQMLVQRVEVVSGGASAVYGSDAVSGVVNFILDTKFEGFKGLLQAGISGYGDAKSFRVGLAGGTDIGSHGHLIWSLEYQDRDGIPDSASRPYGTLLAAIVGKGTQAVPYQLTTNTHRSNLAFGGLVDNGPFKGQQFAPNGTLVPFAPGIPTVTAPYAIGGDGAYTEHEYLVPVLNVGQAFARYDHDFNGNIKAYIQAGYANSRTFSNGVAIPFDPTGTPMTIYSGNAFLLPQYQAVLTATKTPSFGLDLYSNQISQGMYFSTQTDAASLTAGLEGTVLKDFNWDAYYTHGDTRTQQTSTGNVNLQRTYAALDAVKDPATGRIVCNVSITAPGAYPGCVPFNPFGVGATSDAALNYIRGTTWWAARNQMDDFAANITGPLFSNWAGPVKFAAGIEYRLQSLVVTNNEPNIAFDPQYLRVGADGKTVPSAVQKWAKQIQAPGSGAENVYEGNVELDAPLLKDLPLIQLLSFNGAYRYTNYSISGSANTWKAGLEWQVYDDLKIRATRSRDFRAPTLWDLFQQQSITSKGYVDALTGQNASAAFITGGNPKLKPEVANNITAGMVYTPGWLSNFSTSVDFFQIVIANGLGLVDGSSPSVQNICNNSGGASPLCDLYQRPFPISNTTPANFPTVVYALKQNIANVHAEGFDFEANYQVDLSDAGLVGTLGLRALWTHQPNYKSQNLPGSTIINAAGTAQTPKDRATFTLDYRVGDFAINLLERYTASFSYTGDPTLVYNIPRVPAYYQTDMNLSYDFDAADMAMTTFLNVSNLLDAKGDVYMTGSNPGSRYPVGPNVDIIGRYFTIGLRVRS
jgi:iron complex outermembrane receptor protein